MTDIQNALKQAILDEPETTKKNNPYQWSSITLGDLMPQTWVDNTQNTITNFKKIVDQKQRQVSALVDDTLNVINQIDGLSRNLKDLQKDTTDFLSNFFDTGAHYRIIGFDAEISNNGELNRELRRVLDPVIFGPSGTNSDPNFPNFVGDTARVGGFCLLFGAPSLEKIAEKFRQLGKYFPGIGEGYLGGKEAFIESLKKTKDKLKYTQQLKLNWKNQFDEFKKNNENLLNLKELSADVETITDTDRWHGLSLAQLIPALDPFQEGSPANTALQNINAQFEQVQSLFGVVDGARAAVNKLNESIRKVQQTINAAQDFVDDVIEGVFDTGLFFHAYGTEYDFNNTLEFAEGVTASVDDVSDPNRPTFEGDTLYVGGIIAVVGGADPKGFADTFKGFSNTFKSIGLAAESWGRTFEDLTRLRPEKSEEVGAVAIVPANTELPSPTVSAALLEDLESRTLVSDSVPSEAVVEAFLIQSQDIPPVNAGETVEYTSANNIQVITQADDKERITVTITSDNVITVKRFNGEFVATNQNQTTSVIKNGEVKNFFAGEQLARSDGSVLKQIGNSITVFFSDGSTSQIKRDGSSTVTKVDGTMVTTSPEGTRTEKFPTGVVKKYDRDGTLVEETGPKDDKTQEETQLGQTRYLDDGSIEYTAGDGTITITKVETDGTTTIIKRFTDGTEEVTKADGTVITTTQTERTTALTDGRTKVEPIESYDTYGIEFTGEVIWTEVDGTQRRFGTDGSQEITSPGGTVTIIYADGSSTTTRPDGTTRNILADGTITEIRKDGTKIITFPDGKIQQIKSDGSFVIINTDGSVETGTQVGTVTVREDDGSISLKKTAVLEIRQQSDGTIEKENEETGQTIIITPNKITTTQADGTVVETTDTQTKTIDDEGNTIIEDISIETGTEIVDEVERNVVIKVTIITKINAEGQQSITTERETIGDIVNVVASDGSTKTLEVPAIRTVEDKNITTISDFGDFLHVIFPAVKDLHTVLTTDKRSGEVTTRRLKTSELSSLSIDNLNEFDG